jgi:hypothetical protein
VTVTARHRSYSFEGFDEQLLGFGGANDERCILIIPPLFDEMNRVRRMLVQTMRELSGRRISSVLPDLPGTNESRAKLLDQDLDTWRAALSAAAAQVGATHVASLRGGTLIDDGISAPHWRLAPVKGSNLLKAMLRTRIAGDKEAGIVSTREQLIASAQHAPLELAGNVLSPAMLASLDKAEPVLTGSVREVALDEIEGSALWLRAEPHEDQAMSSAIAAELDCWSAACGG